MHASDTQRKRFIARIHTPFERVLGTHLDSEFHQLRIEKVRSAAVWLMLERPREILFKLGQRLTRSATKAGQWICRIFLVVDQPRRVATGKVLPNYDGKSMHKP